MTTAAYFPEYEAIYRRFGDRTEETVRTVAERYIGANPKHPPVYRVFSEEGFIRNGDARYEMDLAGKLPQLREGQFVYVWGKLWSEREAEAAFSLSCYSPLRLYVNGEAVFQSNIMDESFPDRSNGVKARLNRGWNHLVLRCMRTATGCGGRFGSASAKRPIHVLAPSPEREGQEGWLFSGPVDGEWPSLPGEGTSEAETGLVWHPRKEWDEAERKAGRLKRMFGLRPGRTAYAWTKLDVRAADVREYALRCAHRGDVAISVNGRPVFAAAGEGESAFRVRLPFGRHDLLVRSACGEEEWGFEVGVASPGNGLIAFAPPHPVEGAVDHWLFLGTFAESHACRADDLIRMDTVFDNGEDGAYWRVDLPGGSVRVYLENPLFGGWNYPLGVTLYGLLEAGLELGRDDYVRYALDHIECATSHDRYALWDRARYGAAGINPLLSAIDSLDDCGSFGAATLRAMAVREPRGAREAADRVADYIRHRQDRLADGALYRVRGSVAFMKDTMWCDDLYMSTPFLCRYYSLTGDPACLDDACSQFLLYKKYLYMPERQIMSHIYDFKFGEANRIPWGRGNGWVLFSLAELLTALPGPHPRREELMRFYRALCEGCLRLQGTNGLWHQVLTLPESYEETSCTAMFVYAFARGVRCGWLEDPQPYLEAVRRGWAGLARVSIDKLGNVYGVCRGSGYSFSPLYYKDELSWNLNDTHGIGIVLLAGVETQRMRNALGAKQDCSTS